jgi:hypothetical protein
MDTPIYQLTMAIKQPDAFARRSSNPHLLIGGARTHEFIYPAFAHAKVKKGPTRGAWILFAVDDHW